MDPLRRDYGGEVFTLLNFPKGTLFNRVNPQVLTDSRPLRGEASAKLLILEPLVGHSGLSGRSRPDATGLCADRHEMAVFR